MTGVQNFYDEFRQNAKYLTNESYSKFYSWILQFIVFFLGLNAYFIDDSQLVKYKNFNSSCVTFHILLQ